MATAASSSTASPVNVGAALLPAAVMPPSPSRNIFSQFFILNVRGEGIIARDYRGDMPKGLTELFFKTVRQKGVVLPYFSKEKVNFVFTRDHRGLYFVLASWRNFSPFFGIELLLRFIKVFKDYCGVLNEESIRANFVLIYELLDEMMDYGVPQSTGTEILKGFVHSRPETVGESASESAIEKLIQLQLRTAPSTSANRSVQADGSQKDEIFIDLLEKLSVLFSAGGSVLTARIDGSIVMRAFLKGAPELRLHLNEDLVVGKGAARYGRVGIDDITFHECARINTFEFDRAVTFHPPDGEFVLLSYRTTDDFKLPFRITVFVEEIDSTKVDVLIKIQMDVPAENFAHNIFVTVPVPKASTSASLELNTSSVSAQSWEFRQQEKLVVWAVRKMLSTQAELSAKLKINLSAPVKNVKQEIGKVSMLFEVPNYSCSQVNIKSLKTTDNSPIPARWVRYITQAASYVQRL